MPSRSPAVQRAARILQVVAEGRATTISGLARETGISKTTCHSTVHELLAVDLLGRAAHDGELVPGHALVSLGLTSVAEALRVAGRAAKAVVRLSTMFDASCIALAMVGNSLIVAARCDPDRPVPPLFDIPIGLSVPAIPPAGRDFAAWAGDKEIEAWLDRLGPDATPELRSHHRAVLAAMRRRGYAMTLEQFSPDRSALLAQMVEALGDDGGLSGLLAELNRHLESRRGELRLAELPQSRVQSLSAPVFDAAGDVVLSLSLTNFPAPVLVETLAPYVDALLAATRSVTQGLGG
jgi:DNA-binding IclR family transcriptional regulator